MNFVPEVLSNIKFDFKMCQKKLCALMKSRAKIFQYRSSHPEVFPGKGVLKISSKCTEEHPCRSVISIKLQSTHAEV